METLYFLHAITIFKYEMIDSTINNTQLETCENNIKIIMKKPIF